MNTLTARGACRAAVLFFASFHAACGGGVPEGRPSDGLLQDPELQRVVELQVQRDGAALAALLSSPSQAVRARAALALGSVQYAEGWVSLAGALDDPDPGVRRDAAFALGQLGSPETLDALVEAFAREKDGTARRALLTAMSKVRTPDASVALLGLEVAAGEEEARTLALARLAAVRGYGTREAQDHFFTRLDDRDPGVRLAASYYFGRMQDPGVWAPRVARIRDVLASMGKSDLAAMHLVQALGRLGDGSDGARLRTWASSARDWRVRANAVSALAGIPADADNREALFRALDDPAPLVSVAAAQSLARGEFPPSELARIKAWMDAHPDRWQAAAPLLGVLARADEREYVFAWLDAIPDEDSFKWAFGIQALAYLPGDGALQRLGKGVGSADPRVQGAAVGTLVQRWSQDRLFSGSAEAYFPVFAAVLRSANPQAAVAAARALADPEFRVLGSEALLVEAYGAMDAAKQAEPMMTILEALTALGSAEAQPLLTEAALRPEPALRSLAARLLEARGLPVPARSTAAPADEGAATVAAVAPSMDWAYLASLGRHPRLVLETEKGRVVLRLNAEEAPLTVQTIARLASEGRYDGVPFHRVVPNFVVQGGDFSTGDGFGGAGFTIRSEFNLIPFDEGVVGMASAGKDTEGSQFFITHSAQPHLDGGYTAFGRVLKGVDVVARLMVGDRITKATVEHGR